jgi:hypothetical protein
MSGQPSSPDSDDAAADSAEKKPGAKPADSPAADATRNKRLVTGAAIGIGSAALVAALLYANRSRKNDKA